MISQTEFLGAIRHEKAHWQREEPQSDYIRGLLYGLRLAEVIAQVCQQDRKRIEGKVA